MSKKINLILIKLNFIKMSWLNTRSITQSFEDRLNEYVVNHSGHNELLDYYAFSDLIADWDKPPRTQINKLYSMYYEKYYNQPGNQSKINKRINHVIGFKNKSKIDSLKRIPEFSQRRIIDNPITNYFPLKENKRYFLHKIANRGTWMIDLMFDSNFIYLIAINVNTRYLDAEPLNALIIEDTFLKTAKKNSTTYLKVLRQIINRNHGIVNLIGDGELVFNSRISRNFYNRNGITFKPVPRQSSTRYESFMNIKSKTEPLHSSLSIIDRVIRTIRDMAYDMKYDIITPNRMSDIVKQYNNAPHATLSKYAGQPTSPIEVENDKDLEEFITRRICQENYLISSQPGFHIPNGTAVKVYNENSKMRKRRTVIQPGNFHIVRYVDDGINRGLYEISDDKNNVQYLPRSKLTLI